MDSAVAVQPRPHSPVQVAESLLPGGPIAPGARARTNFINATHGALSMLLPPPRMELGDLRVRPVGRQCAQAQARISTRGALAWLRRWRRLSRRPWWRRRLATPPGLAAGGSLLHVPDYLSPPCPIGTLHGDRVVVCRMRDSTK